VTPIFRFRNFVSLAAVSCLSLAMSDLAAAGPTQGNPTANTADLAPPKAPVFFVISLRKQHVSMYTADGLYAQSPVSTGQPGHPTPRGIFTILSKELYHHSNIYSGAPMPFMQRITYTGVAMHEGVLPGYAASHGCIRMPHDFAQWLYGVTVGNERVVIAQEDVIPVEIEHPTLPVPKFMTVGRGDTVSSVAQIAKSALAESSEGAGSMTKVDVAIKPGDEGNGAGNVLNPLDFAKIMKVKAARQVEEASAAIAPARQAAELKARDARAAALEYRKVEIAFAAAKERFEQTDLTVKRATGDEAIKVATAGRDAAEAKLKEAKAALEAALQTKTQREEEAETAARAAKAAESAQRFAADAVKAWTRRLAPLSVFISRKTQRLYVRQDYVKVFDLPITIREPEKPIGTHLFIAVPKETTGAPDRRLRWYALTLPEDVPDDEEIGVRRSVGVNAVASTGTIPPRASEALSRIEIPDELAEKLSEMTWAGTALIVSDKEISRETTDFARTDFVVLTGGESGYRTAPSFRSDRSIFDLFR
jgi:hypothetical protein